MAIQRSAPFLAIVGLFAAMLALGLGASAKAAKTPSPVACGDTVTSDVTLTRNLICSGDGLIIGAPGITIDLAGHAINGSGVGVGISGSSMFTLRNGAIRNFETALRFGAAQVTNMTFANNDTGIDLGFSSGNLTIDNSRIVQNRGSGIEMSQGHLILRNSVVKNNGGTGVVTGLGGEFINNDVSSNAGDGIASHNGVSLFEGNRANNNGGDGIYMQLSVATIRGNEATGNGSDGISIDESASLFLPDYRIGNNTTNRNGGFGFGYSVHTLPGPEVVVDEGGNHARHNGNPLQCDVPGLTCTPR